MYNFLLIKYNVKKIIGDCPSHHIGSTTITWTGAVAIVGGTVVFIWDVVDTIRIPSYFPTEVYTENVREIDNLEQFLKEELERIREELE